MFNVRSAFILIILTSNLFVAGFTYSQEDPYLPFAQTMPSPVGGMEGIYRHITYPELAKKAGISGKVYLLAYINERGGVDDVKIVKGLGAGCDEAAIEGVKSAKFSAGKNNGAAVKVKLSLAIVFKID
jgi:protein TonB